MEEEFAAGDDPLASGLGSRRGSDEAVRRVLGSDERDFRDLFETAGLDPARDARFANWSAIDFSSCDLSGFDFTGANLSGCRFDGALIASARFDSAIVERSALRKARDWLEHFDGWTHVRRPPGGGHLPAGAVFLDAPFAPEMVVVPAGLGVMGSTPEETSRFDVPDEHARWEQPRREVRVDRPFAIGRYPVTFDEFDLYCNRTGTKRPDDEGWGRGRRPVINVSWHDAQGYLEWLSELTHLGYRLPTEAEWEYACRAGTRSAFWWGEAWNRDFAKGESGDGRQRGTAPVGDYPANPFGLHDMSGNVYEWCQEELDETFDLVPPGQVDQSTSSTSETAAGRVVRGGTFSNGRWGLRSSFRFWFESEDRSGVVGFRPARTPFTP